MKVTRWVAVAFGILTLVAYLVPLSLRVESEAEAWFGFLLLLAIWYVLGPLLIVVTTVLAAVSSVHDLRSARLSPARRRLIVWVWVGVFVIETGLAVWLVQVNRLASFAVVAVIVSVVLIVTGAAVFFVVRNSRGSDRLSTQAKRSQIAIAAGVLVVILAVAAVLMFQWFFAVPELPFG